MTSTDQTPRLNRAQHGRPAAPVRIVHLGIGNFTRAHQAWYTEHAPDAEQWGIAAFTGRRPDTADALNPQDGLYTLVIGAADGDRYEVISSLSAVHPSTDHAAFLDYLRSPETAIITTTVMRPATSAPTTATSTSPRTSSRATSRGCPPATPTTPRRPPPPRWWPACGPAATPARAP